MEKAVKDRAYEILKKMSLKEKIGQLNQIWYDFDDIEGMKEKIRNGEVGSIILATSATAGNDAQEKAEIEKINELIRTAVEESPSKIPVIFARDVIHGHETVLPVPLALAATFNPELVKKGYECVAKEAANDGIRWSFAPMLDISRDPRWGRCIESCGEDPYLAGKMAKAVVSGFQDNNIAACAKHYIGYGAADGGRDYSNVEITDYSLRNTYLKPFKEAVKSDVATVMSSFNTIGGETPTSSSYLINGLLKDELGFEGFVVSDWASVEQLCWHRLAEDKKEAAEIAVNSGIDMDMVSLCYIENLESLVNEGKVSVKTIDEAVFRILCIKIKFGLFENPYTKQEKIDFNEHDKCAESCADEAMVLLKNKNNILPLESESRAVVAGPMAFEKRSLLGSWTLDGDVSRISSIAEEIKNIDNNVILPESPYLWDECFAYIDKADAVIAVLGESFKMTGEANSLSDIELPAEQLEFIKKLHKKGKPVIGVLCFGRPVALEAAEPYLDAIIYAWHSGTNTAESVSKILFGKVNPSGRLPMTMPRNTGQIPLYYNSLTSRYSLSYYGKANPEYQAYRDRQSTPMYPFGYGLSYTSFLYSDLSCEKTSLSADELKNGEKFKIHIKVKNTGKTAGKETSQCYIRDIKSTLLRPEKELKGFVKEYYLPEEEKEICFSLGFEELGFYNLNGEFIVEPGEFEVYAGPDSFAEEKSIIEVTE